MMWGRVGGRRCGGEEDVELQRGLDDGDSDATQLQVISFSAFSKIS